MSKWEYREECDRCSFLEEELEAARAEIASLEAHWRVAMETGPEPYRSLLADLAAARAENAKMRRWMDLATKWAIDPTADARELAAARARIEEDHVKLCGYVVAIDKAWAERDAARARIAELEGK